jgi:hypothetical protein
MSQKAIPRAEILTPQAKMLNHGFKIFKPQTNCLRLNYNFLGHKPQCLDHVPKCPYHKLKC